MERRPSKIRNYLRYTWKLNMGEDPANEFIRDPQSQTAIDHIEADDPRFALIDALAKKIASTKEAERRSCLAREQLFVRYYKQKKEEIHNELGKSDFFRGKNDYMIESLVIKRIRELTNRELLPEIESLIRNIDFRFLDIIMQNRDAIEQPYQYFLTCQKYLLNNRSVRENHSGPFLALKHGFVERYLDGPIKPDRFIDVSVLGPLKKRMSHREIVNYAKLSVLTRSAIHLLKIDEKSGPSYAFSQGEVRRAYGKLKDRFPAYPDAVLRTALSSNLSYTEYPSLPGLPQYCGLMAKRCARFVPQKRRDRGANGPDESWFSIAGKNAERHGYNRRLLLELKTMAANQGW